jgi:hypothetical protein
MLVLVGELKAESELLMRHRLPFAYIRDVATEGKSDATEDVQFETRLALSMLQAGQGTTLLI